MRVVHRVDLYHFFDKLAECGVFLGLDLYRGLCLENLDAAAIWVFEAAIELGYPCPSIDLYLVHLDLGRGRVDWFLFSLRAWPRLLFVRRRLRSSPAWPRLRQAPPPLLLLLLF